MARFILFARTSQIWEVFDTLNGIRCSFQQYEFNDTQEFTFDPAITPDPLALARCANDMAQWLLEEHPLLLTNSPDAVKHEARKRVGETLKTARIAKGLTVRDLEAKTGLANNHISRIENGKYNATIDTIALIAHALELNAVSLFK